MEYSGTPFFMPFRVGEPVRKPRATYPTVMLNIVKHLNASLCANRFLTSFEMTGKRKSESNSRTVWGLLNTESQRYRVLLYSGLLSFTCSCPFLLLSFLSLLLFFPYCHPERRWGICCRWLYRSVRSTWSCVQPRLNGVWRYLRSASRVSSTTVQPGLNAKVSLLTGWLKFPLFAFPYIIRCKGKSLPESGEKNMFRNIVVIQ